MTLGTMNLCQGVSTNLRRMFLWKMADGDEQLEEDNTQKDIAADYVADFQVFMTKVRSGNFSARNVSFENSSQILELSTPSCSITPLLIDHGLEASNPYGINMASMVDKLAGRLRTMRPPIVL